MARMFSWTSRNKLCSFRQGAWRISQNCSSQIANLWVHHVSLCPASRFSRGCDLQKTQRTAKFGTLQACAFSISSRGEKVSAKVLNAFQEKFLFGTKKPIFSGMCRLSFLSEASRETITFAFIYFIFLYSYLPTPPLKQDMTQGQLLSEV